MTTYTLICLADYTHFKFYTWEDLVNFAKDNLHPDQELRVVKLDWECVSQTPMLSKAGDLK